MEEEAWHLAAIRVRGLRLMRPERSWRPIITIEVDKHDTYEFCMGCDGQNPNLKELFRFRSASMTSILDVKVWHQPQTKKKKRKRHLVATATHSLRELLKRQDVERQPEIRLQCEGKHAKASTGKTQSGASFQVRLRPPPSISKELDETLDDFDANQETEQVPLLLEDGYSSEFSISSHSSDTLNDPPSPIPEVPQVAQPGLRRRRIRGYAVFSEDELLSEEYISDLAEDSTTQVPTASSSGFCQDGKSDDGLSIREEILSIYTREIHLDDAAWVSPSVLPQYVQEVEVPPPMNFAEEMLASFTPYKEMKEATGDSQFEKVFNRLQQEWTYVGGLLIALAALNTGAFSLSNNSIFHVDEWCQCAIAASSISTGLGIACDTWFLFRYNWADLDTFRRRTKDLFDSYFFFCLSARIPSLCMLLSGFSLMLFLGLVAYNAWPQAVLVLSFIIGFMMTLQFLVFGAYWCAGKVMQGGRAGSRHIFTAVQGIRKA